MRRRSITLQLTLLFAMSSTLILLAVGGVLAILIREHFEMEDVMELEARARLAESTAVSPGAVVNATPEIAFPAALPAARPRTADGLGTSPPVIWEAGGRTYRGIARRLAAGQGPVTIVAALDMSHHIVFMAVFRRALWAAVFVGIAFSVPLGWIAARRGMAPLRQFTGLAARISADRLTERLGAEDVPVELTALSSSFNDMLGRLEDSFRRLSDFSSDLAHELRTPITNVMTQTQVSLSRPRSGDDYREVLYSNLEEFQRLARVVEEMLFLARSDHGLELPENAPVDLASETDALIEFFEVLAAERDVRLTRTGEATATGDRLMIRRALANLVSNAIRHAAAGSVVTVALSMGSDDTANVAVENPGADIPADPSRGPGDGGSGLGLAITKTIAEAHGGRIAVISRGGRTRFELSLPRRITKA